MSSDIAAILAQVQEVIEQLLHLPKVSIGTLHAAQELEHNLKAWLKVIDEGDDA